MGGIFMSKENQFTHRIISDFIGGKMKRCQAAELLQVRERTVTRLARRIELKGLVGAIHGNRGQMPVNRTSEALKVDVMALVEKHYFDFNMTHCLEKLASDHKIEISYSVFRRWCHEKNLVKRKKRRSSKVRRSRVRMASEGLLLQMDGSHHKWNGEQEWCLIAAIDDATSDIPYGEFFLSEDTLNCMTVMQRIIERRGIPHAIYVDKAGWFGGLKRQQFCQFKRACEDLGIKVIFADSAEAKGRIERAWDTFQDRLSPEMRLRNIRRIPSANEYLKNEFLPHYWKINNTVPPQSLEVRYQSVPQGVNLNEIFCIKDYRSVRRDHTISWKGERHQITTPLKHSIRGQHIEIRTYQDMTEKVFFAGRVIQLEKLQLQRAKAA
jgi:transposase